MVDNNSSEAKKPEQTFQAGDVFASVFKRQGANGEFRVANIRRRYKDATGEWHSSYQYTRNELVKVIEVAQQALEHIEQHEPAPAAEKQAA